MSREISLSHSYENSHTFMHIGIVKYSQFYAWKHSSVVYYKPKACHHIEHRSDSCFTTKIYVVSSLFTGTRIDIQKGMQTVALQMVRNNST